MSTNRVLLSAGGLKISKPGFNVLGSISDSQVSFDSSWPKAQRILLRGTHTVAAGGGPDTIGFGRTLGAVPNVLVLWKPSTDTAWNQMDGYNGGWANASIASQLAGCGVYTDHLSLTGFVPFATDYSYIVLIP